MIRGLIRALCCWSMMYLFVTPAFAEGSSVIIKAAQINYVDHSRQIEACGGVEVTYKDTIIKADLALLDQDLEMVWATGNVEIDYEGASFNGDQFIYDIKTEKGWVTPVATDLTDDAFEGPIYLKAGLGKLENEAAFLDHSTFTSCDRLRPHYHLVAREVEYYPDDRIVFRQVWYWEARVPILFFPYLVISLDDKESMFEVEVGYDVADGWFVYIGYNYILNPQNQGTVYTQLTQYGGNTLGIRNYTENTAYSKWYQDWAYTSNSNSQYEVYDLFELGLGYENWANSKLRWKTDYEHRFHVDLDGSAYSEWTLDLQGLTPYPKLTVIYRNDEDYSEYLSLGGSWSYQSQAKLNINTSGAWYRTEYLTGGESNSFRYNLNATKNWSHSNLGIRVSNSQVISTASSSSQNYLPEITYNIPAINLGWFGNLNYKFQYTDYQYVQVYREIVTSDLHGERWANDLNQSKTLWSNSTSNVSLNSQLRQRYYLVEEIGTEFNAFTESLNFRKTVFKKLAATVGANYTWTEGEVAALFRSAYSDSLLDGGYVSTNLAWNGTKLVANLSTGYNLTYQKANPLNVSVTLIPIQKLSVSFNTIYYWPDDSYYQPGLGWTRFTFNYRRDEAFRVNLGLNFDFQSESWGEKYFETFLKQQLTTNLRIELAARYSDLLEDFSVFSLGTVYDWHCREVLFNYDYIEEKFWLRLKFKAFPQAIIGYGLDPSEYLYVE